MQPGSSSSPFYYRDSNGELAGLGEAHIHSVAPGYFDTVGIPLLAGRDVRSTDGTNAPRAVPINQNLARVIPPDGGSPVGLPLFQNDQGRAPFKIIGVVADAKYDNIRTDAPITVYMPFAQTAIRGATFFVKTTAILCESRA